MHASKKENIPCRRAYNGFGLAFLPLTIKENRKEKGRMTVSRFQVDFAVSKTCFSKTCYCVPSQTMLHCLIHEQISATPEGNIIIIFSTCDAPYLWEKDGFYFRKRSVINSSLQASPIHLFHWTEIQGEKRKKGFIRYWKILLNIF